MTTVAEESAANGRVRRSTTDALSISDVQAIRDLLWSAFPPGDEGFTEDDWNHGLGGVHMILELDDRIVGHASVVERDLHLGARSVRTGYVEAVAIDPARQGRGLGSRLMTDVNAHIRQQFELGALGTGRHRFYERLGWWTWRGPASVRTEHGPERTPDEDGYILVLETPASPPLDLDAPISCEWRSGDVW